MISKKFNDLMKLSSQDTYDVFQIRLIFIKHKKMYKL